MQDRRRQSWTAGILADLGDSGAGSGYTVLAGALRGSQLSSCHAEAKQHPHEGVEQHGNEEPCDHKAQHRNFQSECDPWQKGRVPGTHVHLTSNCSLIAKERHEETHEQKQTG